MESFQFKYPEEETNSGDYDDSRDGGAQLAEAQLQEREKAKQAAARTNEIMANTALREDTYQPEPSGEAFPELDQQEGSASSTGTPEATHNFEPSAEAFPELDQQEGGASFTGTPEATHQFEPSAEAFPELDQVENSDDTEQ